MGEVAESDYSLSTSEAEAYRGVGFRTWLQLVRLRPRLLSGLSWNFGGSDCRKLERLMGKSAQGRIMFNQQTGK